jgi:hypothetical protein
MRQTPSASGTTPLRFAIVGKMFELHTAFASRLQLRLHAKCFVYEFCELIGLIGQQFRKLSYKQKKL